MIIGIDSSNLRSGGTVAHIVEVLNASDLSKTSIDKIIVWGEINNLNKIKNLPWIEKRHEKLLDKGLLHRLWWQATKLSSRAKEEKCDILFVPCGIVFSSFRPFVTMSHNMLPFQFDEIKRYGISFQTIRNILLHIIQKHTFKKSNGIIYLSQFAKNKININKEFFEIIPHGVNDRYRQIPAKQSPINNFSALSPFKLLYVSTIDMYKHQWNVAKAVYLLREEGLPISIDFVGTSYAPALQKLNTALNQFDQDGHYMKYLGPIPSDKLPAIYANANMFIFASTCENFPNILVEAMSCGLPIVSSDRGPMKEILSKDSKYFNPENVDEITDVLRLLILNVTLRQNNANKMYESSKKYSWGNCSQKTFSFIEKVFFLHKNKQ